MNKLIVIGGGGHAKVIISILKKLKKYDIVGYTDIENKGEILGIKYIGDDSVLAELYSNQNIRLAVIGIGHIKSSLIRQECFSKLSKIGFSFPVIISSSAIINEDVSIGEGTVLMDGVVINSGTIIGKQCIINTKVSIDHDCKISNFTHIAPGTTISGGAKVGLNSLIGVGATIIQEIKISESCIIGAGAVVIDNCLKPGTYIGVPARLVR